MENNLLVIIVASLSLIVGSFIGIIIFKIYNRRVNKKILKNANEVLDGTRKNILKHDGEEYDARVFRLRDEHNNQIIIDLKGGGMQKNAEQKKETNKVPEQEIQDSPIIEEDSRSNRKKKRNIGKILRRVRRFG